MFSLFARRLLRCAALILLEFKTTEIRRYRFHATVSFARFAPMRRSIIAHINIRLHVILFNSNSFHHNNAKREEPARDWSGDAINSAVSLMLASCSHRNPVADVIPGRNVP
jgi:hypothetical protein